MRYDVIVIGGGIAGLSCALSLSKKFSIGVFTKGSEINSSSYRAQGGIAISLAALHDETLHIEDTLRAGSYTNKRSEVERMIRSGEKVFSFLKKYGVLFDENAGEIEMTLEGGHSERRIFHCGGDQTGKYMVEALIEAVERSPHITFHRNSSCVDLMVENSCCRGVVIKSGLEQVEVYAQHVVVASGGYSAIYDATTNDSTTTGDAIKLAISYDVKVSHLAMTQFHPTAFFHLKNKRYELLSEALRGEGAYLVDEQENRFMFSYDSRGELATRDIVSKAIINEQQLGKTIFLSLKHLDANYVKKRFPSLYQLCKESHYNLCSDLIPITPVAHYSIGGICVDEKSRSSLKSLYVCGEAAYTGFHGSNRLASNSLLECVVTAIQASESINDSEEKSNDLLIERESESVVQDEKLLWNELIKQFKEVTGIIRQEERVRACVNAFNQYEGRFLLSKERRREWLFYSNILNDILTRPSTGCHLIEKK